jgi:hypothetical protein
LRLLEAEVGAVHLDQLHRFTDPAEAAATLALRRGDPAAIDFYQAHDRIRAGTGEAMLEAAYDAWTTDILTGHTSILIAATSADITALNARARAERITAGHVHGDPDQAVVLRDGNRASVGDWVVTRTNMRSLAWNRGRDWVKNGDTWTITTRHPDGALTVTHRDRGGRGSSVQLPAAYIADSLELAYASTAHRVQGTTTDTAHALVTPEMTREGLYVASTRGRCGTTWYVTTERSSDVGCDHEPDEPRTAVEVLSAVLARKSSEGSATEALRQLHQKATNLPELVRRYDHARTVAAKASLASAAAVLPPAERERILRDPGVTYLAKTIAHAASRGADPRLLLRAAHDYEPLTGTGSHALVIAQRIEDHPRTLGVPSTPAQPGPLPWLAPPDVGHPAWNPYLTARAGLIRSRLDQLGSLAQAYREQYEIASEGDLGEAPDQGSRQASAYQRALEEQARLAAQRHGVTPSIGVIPPPMRHPATHSRNGRHRDYRSWQPTKTTRVHSGRRVTPATSVGR